jgi:hypothetical protein
MANNIALSVYSLLEQGVNSYMFKHLKSPI